MEAPYGGWNTQTLIAGLCHDALIAPWVISGAMDGAAFATYISKVLVSEIEPEPLWSSTIWPRTETRTP